jgi:hypothetical protein
VREAPIAAEPAAPRAGAGQVSVVSVTVVAIAVQRYDVVQQMATPLIEPDAQPPVQLAA